MVPHFHASVRLDARSKPKPPVAPRTVAVLRIGNDRMTDIDIIENASDAAIADFIENRAARRAGGQ